MIRQNITIALAKHSDAPAIAALSRDEIEYELDWSWTPSRVRRAILRREVNVAAAKDGDVLAGFGIMSYADENAGLILFAVDRRYRRKGVGSRIIHWLEQVAVNAGLFEAVVQLREENRGAKAFYDHVGFEVIDRVPGYYANGEVGIVMCKQLGAGAGSPDWLSS